MKIIDRLRSLKNDTEQPADDSPTNENEVGKSTEVFFPLDQLNNHGYILTQVIETRRMRLAGGESGVISMEAREQQLHGKVSAEEIKDACEALRVLIPEFVVQAEAAKNTEESADESPVALGLGVSATSEINRHEPKD